MILFVFVGTLIRAAIGTARLALLRLWLRLRLWRGRRICRGEISRRRRSRGVVGPVVAARRQVWRFRRPDGLWCLTLRFGRHVGTRLRRGGEGRADRPRRLIGCGRRLVSHGADRELIVLPAAIEGRAGCGIVVVSRQIHARMSIRRLIEIPVAGTIVRRRESLRVRRCGVVSTLIVHG